MPFVGMPVASPEDAYVSYSGAVSDVDVHADVGSPTLPVQLTVFLDSTAIVSSTDPLTPAMDFSGFNSSSTIVVINEGVVQGAGGEGGAGAYAYANGNGSGASVWAAGYGGGGAGGNGNAGGVGGAATSPGNAGTVGAVHPTTTAQAGGAALTNFPGSQTPTDFAQDATDGGTGGDAMNLGDVAIILTNDGSIWGGGGGGGGGGAEAAPEGGTITVPGNFNPEAEAAAGGDGGGPGLPGADGVTPTAVRPFRRQRGNPGVGGAAGYAIRHTATGGVTFLSGGVSPAVEGTVGV